MWTKKTHAEINEIIFDALSKNVNYTKSNKLGLPASYLDDKVFSQDASLLKDAPFLSTLVQNPNHIGCHTLNSSESYFKGTQEIEKELIRICAEDILHGEPEKFDGYVASGGTEANIQALWIYRNYFQQEHQAASHEIAILCSEDSHYSMDKGANLLGVSIFKVEVIQENRQITSEKIKEQVSNAKSKGIKYFMVVGNMMTTMFGSVDNINLYIEVLDSEQVFYKIHLDGAFGGFYYPFSNKTSQLNFSNEAVCSVTLDAHKMAQAPYGTGIFLIRKDYLKYSNTSSASYVEGEDCTLIGSRSGANAIAIWMILSIYGRYGWMEKIFVLQKRTDWLCEQLKMKNISFFRDEFSNIVTIPSSEIALEVAHQYGLVPDNHKNPNWFKIVVMEHVTIDKLIQFLERTGIHQKVQ
jgi:tyrosine decarboxylase / aspartate 1-decarboxylase